MSIYVQMLSIYCAITSLKHDAVAAGHGQPHRARPSPAATGPLYVAHFFIRLWRAKGSIYVETLSERFATMAEKKYRKEESGGARKRWKKKSDDGVKDLKKEIEMVCRH